MMSRSNAGFWVCGAPGSSRDGVPPWSSQRASGGAFLSGETGAGDAGATSPGDGRGGARTPRECGSDAESRTRLVRSGDPERLWSRLCTSSGDTSCSDKCLADLLHGFRQRGEHDLCIEPKDPIPQTPEPAIAPSISLSAIGVIGPINFEDQFRLGSEEVHDVLTENCLPAKRNAKPFSPERCPERALRSSGRNAHLMSARGEKLRALSKAGIPRAHSDLRDAACCRACAPQGAGSVPRPRRAACTSPGAAESVRPSQTGPAACRVVEPRRAALRHPSDVKPRRPRRTAALPTEPLYWLPFGSAAGSTSSH